MSLINQLKSVIQWENPNEDELFVKYTDKGNEIKNASKLILQPGQGCVLTYEGKMVDTLIDEGMYDIQSDNKPFLTTLRKYIGLQAGSEHIVGLWFFRKADILNMRWGTRVPIAYKDPIYKFPILLTAFGNYSIKIINPTYFFVNILAGQEYYTKAELKEVFVSRVVQPITDYLANAKFSFQEIDAHLIEIAKNTQELTNSVFTDLGFQVVDFRIEGTQFDTETLNRINEISDIQAEVNAAEIAGVDFAQLQQLKALRDAAKNQGGAGMMMGMMTGLNINQQNQPITTTSTGISKEEIKAKLKDLKELFEDELISEEEYNEKKKDLLSKL